MPLEIEIKLKLDSHEPVRAALKKAKAKLLQRVLETNRFFDFPDRRLLKKNSGLRVRTEAPLGRRAGKKAPPSALLTVKGPPQRRGLRARNAYDLTLTPADQIIPLIESLGLIQTLAYDKRRESWLFRGCRIELDEVPRLGLFLEIEGPSEKSVRAVQRALGLAALPPVKPSYVHMIDEYLKSHRPIARTLRF